MKKVIFVVLLLICWTNVFSQNDSIVFDDKGEFSRVVVVKASAKQAFQYSRAFLSNKIKEYQKAVQFEDAEAYKIQVNTQFFFKENAKAMPSGQPVFTGYELFKFSVDCKDNKIRVKIENPTYNYDLSVGNMKFDSRKNQPYFLVLSGVADKQHFLDSRSSYYRYFINSLVKYIEKQVSEEDF